MKCEECELGYKRSKDPMMGLIYHTVDSRHPLCDDQTSPVYYYDNQRHLVCVPYTEENLHVMAEALEIDRRWFHRGGTSSEYAHYDIPARRIKEIGAKCNLVDAKYILLLIKDGLAQHPCSSSVSTTVG